MNKILYMMTVLVFACSSVPHEKLYYAAQATLPRVTKDMKTPGFWISRHKAPDRIIMTGSDIESLNTIIANSSGKVLDFSKNVHKFNSAELIYAMEKDFTYYKKKNLYDKEAIKNNSSFFESVYRQMNISALVDPVFTRYGYIVHLTSERVFPTLDPLYAEPFDFEFDELQRNFLDIGTPVIVVHESLDKEWVYVQSQISEGWIKKENVHFEIFEDWVKGLAAKNFVIANSPKTEIFLDQGLYKYYDYVIMGTRLPFSKKVEGLPVYEVWIPSTKAEVPHWIKAYVKESAVNIGYMPYTARNIYEQAFKFLNAPYGWGGQNGEQDCSRFIQAVFACFGIKLPRNSMYQELSGISLLPKTVQLVPQDLEQLIVMKAEPAITFFILQGHVMLYLGSVDGKPYVIHDIFSYSHKLGDDVYKRAIAKVAVTDLMLGEGAPKKSFLERIKDIRVLNID